MTSDQAVNRVTTDHTKLVLTAGFPQFSAIDLFGYFTKPDLLTLWWPQELVTEPHAGGRYQPTISRIKKIDRVIGTAGITSWASCNN